jgi:uncharacterized SAM-binding protein YcdF (DUF218 family)
VIRLTTVGLVVWLGITAWRISVFSDTETHPGKVDFAVVLGASAPHGKPSPVFAARIDYAVELYLAGRADQILFTGGRGEGESIPDALAAKSYAVALGVPADSILIEATSRTTRENLMEARRLLSDKPAVTCFLVSDPLHLFRATRMMKDVGITGYAAPTPYTRIRSWNNKLSFLAREVWFYHVYLLLEK